MKKIILKNMQTQLALILVLLFSVTGSSWGKHPCAPRFDSAISKGHADWLTDHCEAKLSTFHLICSGGFHDKWDTGSEGVRILTLCRWPDKTIDPEEILQKFPSLQSLIILDSDLTHLKNPFPSNATELQSVKFNGTKLEVLPNDAFSQLPSLRILDLRHNSLSLMNEHALMAPSIQEVYLMGNEWKCVSEMSWILNMENDSVASRVVDRDKLMCSVPYYDRPLVPVVEIITELEEECLKTDCQCVLSYVGRRTLGAANQKELMAFASVNCSSRGLTEMPDFLPKNTSTLYLSKNQIHDLTPLLKNPIYKEVIDIYLDDNNIESISLLEGSYWLDHFRALSLRGNRLTDLPPYALENALQQNGHAASIFLGKNPWRCDCHFTPGFQDLLSRHPSLFKDVNEITCSKVENDENSEKTIRELSRTAICTSPADEYWLQPLDILNVVLASMIIFVLGKLLYDYWTFKRTGKLPWIVAKIP
ncbi:protein singed wings 2 isoform X2 [Athalia rosae]|uniref:protein singed wings 2 isoform X2 n=1 Tax=Athalia rosae TaxID=37344 RepID=UPI00203451ED|nr:protein singed wings 2 isoform X2 [Athalia rosae]XP_048505116.1 protein singed wings 2 isoform X2 [Athalia rosae]XP_048505118.1 protein singed wings 2 isoform X2 [Athalia rosae]